jgi:hypothetical protein
MSPTCRLIVVFFAFLASFVSTAHARWFSTSTGRWIARDPLGYHDGMGLYEYVKSSSLTKRDFSGLSASSAPCDADPRDILPDEEWYLGICPKINPKVPSGRGSCYRFAVACPTVKIVPLYPGHPRTDPEPPGPLPGLKETCTCSRYMKRLEGAGLVPNGILSPPPPCVDGYNIAVYFTAPGPCVDSGRHFRRQEKDGSWREILGSCSPSSVDPATLQYTISLNDNTQLVFCGFMCRRFDSRQEDLVDPISEI